MLSFLLSAISLLEYFQTQNNSTFYCMKKGHRHTYLCPKPFFINPPIKRTDTLRFLLISLFTLSQEFMCFSFMYIFLYSLVILLPFLSSESAKVVRDGVSGWETPQIQTGDSVIFQLRFHCSLYIFQNKKAFGLCNFTQATILAGPNSTSYTWHASCPGFFYFSLNNGSNEACLDGQKRVVKVSLAPPQDPSSISGRFVVSSPAFPWPFQPHEHAPPSIPLPVNSPVGPHRDGIPFISSNPAVPLPTGEVDSATILPLSTSGCQHSKQIALSSMILLLLLLMMMMII